MSAVDVHDDNSGGSRRLLHEKDFRAIRRDFWEALIVDDIGDLPYDCAIKADFIDIKITGTVGTDQQRLPAWQP